jgi:Cellulase (glycosyl hydrolase family 5)
VISNRLLAVTGAAQQKAGSKAAPPAAKPNAAKVISVDPVNPRYLRFRGRTVVLITSGEHYGAVLNSAFDYVKYLDTLHALGMNLTRIFNGTYVEPLDDLMFPGGDQNTLAPKGGAYLAPWARTGAPGYTGGGRKFDLTRWDDDYFKRLKSFVAEAGKRDIVVEVTLFSTNYGTGKNRWGGWSLNPMNAANNINNVGGISWDRFNTMDDAALAAAQDAVVRKTVAELNAMDNVYYEVCNEPWFSGAPSRQTQAWINHIAATVQAAEASLPNKHLIAENVADDRAPEDKGGGGNVTPGKATPAISLYNLHSPVGALTWGLRKPMALDQTSNGCEMLERRREAWTFLLSGGAVYNNLDLSFTTDDPEGKGDAVNCNGARYALQNLAQFMTGLDLAHMQPDRESVSQWSQYASEIHLLDDPGRVYALYFKGGSDARATTILLEAPAGRYQMDWINPRTSDVVPGTPADHNGGSMKITTPEYTEDLAMKLVRIGDLPAVKPAPPPAPRPTGPRQPARRPPPS